MVFACTFGHRSRSALVRLTATGAFFLAAGAAFAGCGQPMEAGRHALTIEADGITRQAVYYVPSSYTGNDKVPVVFDFHGSNSNPTGQLNRSSWDKVAEKNGFIAIALQGSLPGKTPGTFAWNVPHVEVSKAIIPTGGKGGLDEISFIREAVDEVKEDFCVDPNRIFASGYSGGGRMLSAYLCSGGEGFTGAGFVNSLRAGRPVETDGKWGPDKENCSPAKPISIMAFAGIKDRQNPYAGGGAAYWQYSFKTAIQRWTDLDGCKGNDNSKTVDDVTFSMYGTCKNGARIASYVFANGTHDWPKPVAAKQAVIAAAKDGAASVTKVAAVASSAKAAFDTNVDPAFRMWDFFGKADSTDVVATAAPAKSKAGAKSGTSVASDCAIQAEIEGTSCSSSQPINMRRSGQGVQDAL
ncbi:polyhydroxybutyrate depolymerase [Rhizobium sp. NFR07]|nr:polyhydroxybutyrate depolymerase [Rhizobium sp. NFR07]